MRVFRVFSAIRLRDEQTIHVRLQERKYIVALEKNVCSSVAPVRPLNVHHQQAAKHRGAIRQCCLSKDCFAVTTAELCCVASCTSCLGIISSSLVDRPVGQFHCRPKLVPKSQEKQIPVEFLQHAVPKIGALGINSECGISLLASAFGILPDSENAEPYR